MRQEAGFSLVELLVALAISAILTLGVMELLTANQASGRLLRGQAALGEAGRLAMMLVVRDLRQAGYRECQALTAGELGVVGLPYEFDLLRGLQGFEATGDGWAPDFASAGLPVRDGGRDARVYAGARSRSGVNLGVLRPGSDFFTVWFLGAPAYPLANRLVDGDEALLLNVSKAAVENDLQRDHIAFIGDCVRERLFMVTALDERGGQARLGHNASRRVGGATGNASANLGGGFGPGAALSPIRSRTYYVGRASNANNLGEPVFSLYLKEGAARPVELAEGVEDLQLLYGVNRDPADPGPDLWLDASQVADFRAVVSVRVQLTASSIDSLNGIGGDGLLRRTLVQTVTLRNRRR